MNKKPDLFTMTWRKSSHSGGSGGECIEIADFWQKSSHSGGSGGNCVEVTVLETR